MSSFVHHANEPDIQYEADGARMMLLRMNFPQNLVDLALSRLGKGTPVDEMIDFITAAQLAEEYAEESEDLLDGTETNREDENVILSTEVPSELLFEEMGKTLQLLERGFSHDEISKEIEKLGEKLRQLHKVSAAPATCPSKSWRFVGVNAKKKHGDVGSSSGTSNVGESSKSKRKKDKVDRETDRGKRLRPEPMGSSSSVMETPRMNDELIENSYESPSAMQPRLSKMRPLDLVKRPYFFYGNLTELSPQWWSKISRFFFGIHPEIVDTRLWSALRRREGYVHNLPIENRFHILPKPCRSAPNTISPVEPDNMECIMGYPSNHTKIGGGIKLAARMKLLDYCFQTDTLGYHLSVLKPMFPQGLTVLSLFSGIGGAEIALSRLGVHLKVVFSVESCGVSRNIMKRWWQTSGQSGELVQIEDITSLRIKKLENLVQRFGGFDLVICQNPPTPADLSKESSRSEACKFDFMLFNEVVRVSRRVKDLMS
ncbi:unnamed protein product [Eruca vesicaria subsp. sativa]|uniref:SAM-dependent MTase DRM-type domain-containing protein n=1 Tax=Eruca vesicaria subsp. sativa TaxID=29727 RepID=A0ABC8M6X9_ERUVS|nr:unnamed protein product [Eruca vesicaria subsp. sativa]